jgi:hypothetical protein
MQVDLPALEHELHIRKSDSGVKGFVASKISRLETVLDELQKDDWLSRQVAKQPELAEKIEAVRQAVEAMKSEAEKIQ